MAKSFKDYLPKISFINLGKEKIAKQTIRSSLAHTVMYAKGEDGKPYRVAIGCEEKIKTGSGETMYYGFDGLTKPGWNHYKMDEESGLLVIVSGSEFLHTDANTLLLTTLSTTYDAEWPEEFTNPSLEYAAKHNANEAFHFTVCIAPDAYVDALYEKMQEEIQMAEKAEEAAKAAKEEHANNQNTSDKEQSESSDKEPTE